MKYPKLKALLGLYVFIMALGFVQSCCSSEMTITGGGELHPHTTLGYEVDTVTGPFSLSAYFEVERTTASNFTSGFANSAYAFSCGINYINALENSFQLTLDKPFIYNGDTIVVGENIIELDKVIEHFEAEARETIHLSEDFLRISQFEPGAYTFTLNGRTTDGIDLISSVEPYIRL